MAKYTRKADRVEDVEDVETQTEDVVEAVEEIKKTAEAESYLVRWIGGAERFESKSKAEFAAKTHKGGYVV